MRVLITGTTTGMGREAALLFLKRGDEVFGLDVFPSTIEDAKYVHYVCDVSRDELPDISGVDILVNNAGIQSDDESSIAVNLIGVIRCTEKYGLQSNIKSILNQASVSAHNGAEMGWYTASKGGVLAYTKWTAKQVAKYGATCNSLSFGGVLTELNNTVIQNKKLWDKIMEMTPLKKWATAQEAAEWIYFLTVMNKSMTAQDLIIDNGEFMNHQFVWED